MMVIGLLDIKHLTGLLRCLFVVKRDFSHSQIPGSAT